MLAHQLTPRVICDCALMSACEMDRLPERAQMLFEATLVQQMMHAVIVYNALIGACE